MYFDPAGVGGRYLDTVQQFLDLIYQDVNQVAEGGNQLSGDSRIAGP
jgi:hypothetical protein